MNPLIVVISKGVSNPFGGIMSVLDISSYIVAALLAISRVVDSTKPYWRFLPGKVAMFVPAIVAMIPVLADKVGMAHSGLDLVNAFIVAGALLLPGAGATPPPNPDV